MGLCQHSVTELLFHIIFNLALIQSLADSTCLDWLRSWKLFNFPPKHHQRFPWLFSNCTKHKSSVLWSWEQETESVQCSVHQYVYFNIQYTERIFRLFSKCTSHYRQTDFMFNILYLHNILLLCTDIQVPFMYKYTTNTLQHTWPVGVFLVVWQPLLCFTLFGRR